ncbi:UNVERIFIED_CONTAM: hypothetical protein Sangu_2326700 [Sesamum angustifolium]|uniref:Uncharacterized protein n=1 Tax=Sesamum angustifolium TaxID=2727405 RepID=A0AAW2L7I9_9LAMI
MPCPCFPACRSVAYKPIAAALSAGTQRTTRNTSSCEATFHNCLALSGIPCRSLICEHTNAEFWVRGLYCALDKEGFRRALLVCWFLWCARNKLLFENVHLEAHTIMERVLGFEASLTERPLGTEGFEEATRQAFHSLPRPNSN